MRCSDKLRAYMRKNAGPFRILDLCEALHAADSTIFNGLRELIQSGEVITRNKAAGRHHLYYPTSKLAPADDQQPDPRPRIIGGRIIRFCENKHDASPERGIYYHRPQPAQTSVQTISCFASARNLSARGNRK